MPPPGSTRPGRRSDRCHLHPPGPTAGSTSSPAIHGRCTTSLYLPPEAGEGSDVTAPISSPRRARHSPPSDHGWSGGRLLRLPNRRAQLSARLAFPPSSLHHRQRDQGRLPPAPANALRSAVVGPVVATTPPIFRPAPGTGTPSAWTDDLRCAELPRVSRQISRVDQMASRRRKRVSGVSCS